MKTELKYGFQPAGETTLVSSSPPSMDVSGGHPPPCTN